MGRWFLVLSLFSSLAAAQSREDQFKLQHLKPIPTGDLPHTSGPGFSSDNKRNRETGGPFAGNEQSRVSHCRFVRCQRRSN